MIQNWREGERMSKRTRYVATSMYYVCVCVCFGCGCCMALMESEKAHWSRTLFLGKLRERQRGYVWTLRTSLAPLASGAGVTRVALGAWAEAAVGVVPWPLVSRHLDVGGEYVWTRMLAL